jgi:hypothetical protein
VRTYFGHYNRATPHRALDLRPPQATSASGPPVCGAIHLWVPETRFRDRGCLRKVEATGLAVPRVLAVSRVLADELDGDSEVEVGPVAVGGEYGDVEPLRAA